MKYYSVQSLQRVANTGAMDTMYHLNSMPHNGEPLDTATIALLGDQGADAVAEILKLRSNHKVTPLENLGALARSLGIASLHVKD